MENSVISANAHRYFDVYYTYVTFHSMFLFYCFFDVNVIRTSFILIIKFLWQIQRKFCVVFYTFFCLLLKPLYFIVLYVSRLEPLVNATFRIFIVSSSENTISSSRANKFKPVHTFVSLNQSEISSLRFEVKTKVNNEMPPLKVISKSGTLFLYCFTQFSITFRV